MNTDDVTSDWLVFRDESERISQRGEDLFFLELVSHSVSRQMLSPAGVELVQNG